MGCCQEDDDDDHTWGLYLALAFFLAGLIGFLIGRLL